MYGAQEAYDLLEKQVKGREDYVYEKPLVTYEYDEGPYEAETTDCAYSTPGGDPSCLVGHVLWDVMDDEQWAEVRSSEYDDGVEFIGGIGISHLEPAECLFDGAAIAVLQVAQNMQDRGTRWGEALDAAGTLVSS